mmetsp:Transcript_125647/g.250729  ORF Transcript_125647/g.250729 Transcript_125647/m.250729 type:complete len:302 (+) Transcript_125647:83-988(+)
MKRRLSHCSFCWTEQVMKSHLSYKGHAHLSCKLPNDLPEGFQHRRYRRTTQCRKHMARMVDVAQAHCCGVELLWKRAGFCLDSGGSQRVPWLAAPLHRAAQACCPTAGRKSRSSPRQPGALRVGRSSQPCDIGECLPVQLRAQGVELAVREVAAALQSDGPVNLHAAPVLVVCVVPIAGVVSGDPPWHVEFHVSSEPLLVSIPLPLRALILESCAYHLDLCGQLHSDRELRLQWQQLGRPCSDPHHRSPNRPSIDQGHCRAACMYALCQLFPRLLSSVSVHSAGARVSHLRDLAGSPRFDP